jgi:hypothetical protein
MELAARSIAVAATAFNSSDSARSSPATPLAALSSPPVTLKVWRKMVAMTTIFRHALGHAATVWYIAVLVVTISPRPRSPGELDLPVEDEASRLIVNGFVEPIVKELPME